MSQAQLTSSYYRLFNRLVIGLYARLVFLVRSRVCMATMPFPRQQFVYQYSGHYTPDHTKFRSSEFMPFLYFKRMYTPYAATCMFCKIHEQAIDHINNTT